MHSERLRRSLGLPALLGYGIGVVVGAGIYSILGAAAGEAGRGVWLGLLLSLARSRWGVPAAGMEAGS
jgi:APA family basic amino acid/polyamine antiporter